MSKPTLAVALIVKNEARHLDECLQTVHDWVDEIVVLDSGSHDETEQVARRYTENLRECKVAGLWPAAPIGTILCPIGLCAVAGCR